MYFACKSCGRRVVIERKWRRCDWWLGEPPDGVDYVGRDLVPRSVGNRCPACRKKRRPQRRYQR